jgi:putative membrane protein
MRFPRKRFVRAEIQFWHEALMISGSALPLVLPRALVIGLFALAVTAIDRNDRLPNLRIEITPFEVAGGALGVLLVLRTNAGYERWWEGRKLWGGIVNQSRNLAIAALSYGPDELAWRGRVISTTAAFAYAAKTTLRGDRNPDDIVRLLGPRGAAEVFGADHMPSAVSRRLGDALRDARDRLGMDGFSLMRIDQERATLIDHVGACERILKTPLPLAYRIEIRRFLILFLAVTPLALVDRIEWLTPFVTVLIALPLLAIDKIGTELQNPFLSSGLSRLPLDDICATIERNLLALLKPPSVSDLDGLD